MKRIVAVFIMLSMLMFFAACGDDAADPVVNVGSASMADDSFADLTTILEDIAVSVQPGTMGVSMISASKAVDLLEWCAATDMNTTQIADEVGAYLAALPQESKVLYPEQLLLVTSSAANMQDEEYRTYMLLDIGYDPEGFDWNEETFAKVAAITEKTHGFVVPTE